MSHAAEADRLLIRPTCGWPGRRRQPPADRSDSRHRATTAGHPACHGGHALGCRRQPGIGPASRPDTLSLTALLELLEALKVADVDDRIRTATEALYQALIEAELTAVIGAAPHERTETRTAARSSLSVPSRSTVGRSTSGGGASGSPAARNRPG